MNDWELHIMVADMDTDGDEHICFSEFLRGILNYFGEFGSAAVAGDKFMANMETLRVADGGEEVDQSAGDTSLGHGARRG